ncbi:MAG: four helix bundle protein, partial [Chloroflexi bacterium]
TYDEWEAQIHKRIKGDPVWKFLGYRKAMFLYDLTWEDCHPLRGDYRGRAVVDQLIRSAGSICANIEEGTGRGFQGKEYTYYLRLALGSARETKGWYYRARQLLSPPILEHRLKLLDEIISLLLNQMKYHKNMKP